MSGDMTFLVALSCYKRTLEAFLALRAASAYLRRWQWSGA
jgi:hypothetical protein